MHDHYRSFDDLFAHERCEVDYSICALARQSHVLIMAPHGGGIEPGTSEIARQIAGKDHSLFLFEGMRSHGNWRLHIRSGNYELPDALRMAREARLLITIHGCGDDNHAISLGGRDFQLKRHIAEELTTHRFLVSTAPRCGLGGRSARNICNQNQRNAGVQIEISHGLRRQMFNDLHREGRAEATETFYRFCGSIRSAVIKTIMAR